MAERNIKWRIGLFVAGSLIIFTGLVFLFGRAPTLFSSTSTYTLSFPEAPGVQPGIPIRKSGVRIGQVTNLEIDEETGSVRIFIEVEKRYRPRTNEEPFISQGLLSGDTSIDFIPKTDEKQRPLPRGDYYPTNTEIVGIPPFNRGQLQKTVQSAIPNTQEAVNKFLSSVQKFDGVGPKAEQALDEIRLFVRDARELVPEIRSTNKRIQDFIGPGESETIPPPKQIPPGMVTTELQPEPPGKQAANLQSLVREVQAFVAAYKPLADDLRKAVKESGPELTKALKALAEFSQGAQQVLSEENRKALANILKNLDQASADILSEENKKNINLILKNLQVGSDDLTKSIRLAGILLDRADTTLKEFNKRIAQVDIILQNVEQATKPLAKNVGPAVEKLTLSADELAKTLTEARKFIQLLSKQEGTLSKIVSDPALYNNLVDSTASLNRTLIRAEKIARDLEVFADKIARKPETIGAAGIVRPSTGLKEDPRSPLPENPLLPPPRVRYPYTGPSLIPPVSSYRQSAYSPELGPGPRLYPQQPAASIGSIQGHK